MAQYFLNSKLFKIIRQFHFLLAVVGFLGLGIGCTGVGTDGVIDANLPTVGDLSNPVGGNSAAPADNNGDGIPDGDSSDITENSDETSGRPSQDAVQKPGPGPVDTTSPCGGPKAFVGCAGELEFHHSNITAE